MSQTKNTKNSYNQTFKGLADFVTLLVGLAKSAVGSGTEATPAWAQKPQAQEVTPVLAEDAPQTTGTFKRKTYYTPNETPAYDKKGMLTATGTTPKPGYTVAVSPDMLKSHGGTLKTGDLLEIGGKQFRVEDLTNESLKGTVDVYMEEVSPDTKGLEQDVPFKVVGRNKEGLKYNISED